MSVRILVCLSSALALLAPHAASAEVKRSDADGFVVEHVVSVTAAPGAVWRMLGTPAAWWDAAHSWSGDAANLSIDTRAGGCFCERLAGGGSVEHARVVHAAPGSLLRMVGALGPLQAEAVQGVDSPRRRGKRGNAALCGVGADGGAARFDRARGRRRAGRAGATARKGVGDPLNGWAAGFRAGSPIDS